MTMRKQRAGESAEEYMAACEEARRRKLDNMRRKYQEDADHRETIKARVRDWAARPENLPSLRSSQRKAKRWVRPQPPPGQVCELCGVVPPPRSNGSRGLNQDHRHDTNAVRGWLCTKCNLQVAVLDLRFSDPDRFAALAEWSSRGAPVVPVRSENPERRRPATEHPKLFEPAK